MSAQSPRFPLNSRLLTVLILVGCVAIAFAIRVLWPYNNVFVDGSVWFRGMDPWYHMRLVHNLIQNFPHLTPFDPYTYYPHGIIPPFRPLTGWLIAVPALILGKGAPSPQLVDTVGAVFPAVLGSLTVVPAYFIGRSLYGRLAGIVSAVILAVMPGEFLSRTMLGFADHHATESLFAALTLLFAMVATDRATSAGFTLRGMRAQLTTTARSAVLFTIAGGVSLGLYLLAWRGGLMILAVLLLYSLIRMILDYRHGKRIDDAVLVCSLMSAVGSVMVAPLVATSYMSDLLILALFASTFGPIGFWFISSFALRRRWTFGRFLLFLSAFVLVAIALVALIWPAAFEYAKVALSFMLLFSSTHSITEMQPLLMPNGVFGMRVAWTNFVTILPASLLALVVLWRSPRSPHSNKLTLFIVWSIFMLFVVLAQRRFGYYYSLNAAVLVGLLAAWIWNTRWCQGQVSALKHALPISKKPAGKSEKRALLAHRRERRTSAVMIALVVALFCAATVVPCVRMARNFAVEPSLMTNGWYETLVWLRENTPEPMPAGAFMELIDRPTGSQDYDYPPDSYSIMAWWDYGHWLTSVSQRIPVSNPFQDGARVAAKYLSAPTEQEGTPQLKALDSRYVVIDGKTSVASFPAVIQWAGYERDEFMEIYSQRTADGVWEPIVLYYPRYYESMAVRLYNFSAGSSLPEEFTVIRYKEDEAAREGEKQLVGVQTFSTYEDAIAYLEESNDGHLRLVSSDPFVSACPLEALQGYSPVFSSSSTMLISGHRMPEVMVFECLD
ncbi:MAG: oligosaccharyl transferase, archaeosortase A system-associated [Dehalococcoidia bacterium]|nr:oligosaccharyl transferase, archaeosortase A system-associated [Dehalococcoidia bacterium]